MINARTRNESFDKLYSQMLKNYEIDDILWETERSVLFKAFHKEFKKWRVIKSVRTKGDVATLDRLINQEKYLKLLKGHPHILKLKTSIISNQRCMLVTELCHGQDLMTYLLAKRRFSQLEAGLIMKQVFATLSFAHEQGVLHRDIRPENILVRESTNWSIKLTGFDYACHISEAQSQSPTVGSPLYLAPEVLSGKGYQYSRDIWSCAVVLFMMLTGTSLFGGDDDLETLQIISKCKEKDIIKKIRFWQRKRHLSEQVTDLLINMLKKEERERITLSQLNRHPWIEQNGWVSQDESSPSCSSYD